MSALYSILVTLDCYCFVLLLLLLFCLFWDLFYFIHLAFRTHVSSCIRDILIIPNPFYYFWGVTILIGILLFIFFPFIYFERQPWKNVSNSIISIYQDKINKLSHYHYKYIKRRTEDACTIITHYRLWKECELYESQNKSHHMLWFLFEEVVRRLPNWREDAPLYISCYDYNHYSKKDISSIDLKKLLVWHWFIHSHGHIFSIRTALRHYLFNNKWWSKEPDTK
jgi:hypothetical protein